ncbi:MAG: hypothetical protein HQL69_14750 [Magnetococcales bacterium]|nr:hypothetical protein [Magnetococcales bacterium]
MKIKLSFTTFLVLIWVAFSSASLHADTNDEHSLAVQAYKQFANAFITGEFITARLLSTGDARKVVGRKEELVRNGEKLLAIEEPMFMIVSEIATPEGDEVWLHAVQIVQGSSQEEMFKPPVLHRQFVTLLKESGKWKVISFQDDKEKCCSE